MYTTSSFQYGNPSIECIHTIASSSFLDVVFSECSKMNFPNHDSEVVKKELNQSVTCIEQLSKDTELLQRFTQYDRSLFHVLTNLKLFEEEEMNKQYQETIKNIFEDVRPLLYKLKLHYQRPRPFQLGHYHKLKLFPFNSYSAGCPAFPSLHTCLAKVIAEVCGNKHPKELFRFFKDTATDIAYSRLYMGLCLQSDVDAGVFVAEKILANKEFIVKYNL